MDFRYVRNYANQEATMLLYSNIGDDGINGNYFAQELFYLDQNGCKKINVRINCNGGTVLHGYSILSAILSTKCRIDTYNDGVAASMGGVIFLAGKKRFMKDYSLFMMHNPQGKVESVQDFELMNLIKGSLKTILSNRSGQAPEIVDEMMNANTWMDASECLEKGFCDEIEKTVNPKLLKTDSVENLLTITNSYLNPRNNKMFEKVTNALNLQVGASEDSIASAITNLLTAKNAAETALGAKAKEIETLNNSVSTLTNSIAELNTKLKEKEDAEKASLLALATNKAEALVTEAVKVGKIANTAKDAWVKLAVENYDSTKILIDGIAINKKTVDLNQVENQAYDVVPYSMAAQMMEIQNRNK